MPQRRSHLPVPPESPHSSTKRARSPPPTKITPSRQSKRLKSSPETKTTPKKSPYFEHPTSESDPEPEEDNESSNYEDEDASVVSSPPSSGDEEVEEDAQSDFDSAEDKESKGAKRRGRKPGVKANGTPTLIKIGKKGQELWRPGVKSNLAPGEAVFIKLPKARAAGSTPYLPSTVHPNTLLFLGDLKANNDRDWLKTHDADYRASKADWDSFVEALTEKIIEKDETVPELPPKDLTFRIYRDVRFSPDPTPYKTHFSAAWSRTGRKGPYAGYYLQIQPKGSFVGAGVWHPEAAPINAIRQDLDRKSHKLKDVLLASEMRNQYFNGCKPDEKAVGYEADNPNIVLLRLRNFTIGKKLKDDEVLGEGGIQRIADLIGVLTPFVTYLNNVVMPDGAPSDEEEEEEEEGDEDKDEE